MTKQEAADYIRSKAHLLKKKDLSTLYDEYESDYESGSAKELTELFWEIGIDPLSYMEYVPMAYAAEMDTTMSIDIPNNVIGIGNGAFFYCSNLVSVTIPDSVTRIYDHAFCDCHGLKSVRMPKEVEFIDDSAFRDCRSLTSITIPNKMSHIKLCTFDGCVSLTSVKIPKSITYIDTYAFRDCFKLTSIYYSGSKKEWNSIDKDDEWDVDSGNYVVHCTDGTINKGKF